MCPVPFIVYSVCTKQIKLLSTHLTCTGFLIHFNIYLIGTVHVNEHETQPKGCKHDSLQPQANFRPLYTELCHWRQGGLSALPKALPPETLLHVLVHVWLHVKVQVWWVMLWWFYYLLCNLCWLCAVFKAKVFKPLPLGTVATKIAKEKAKSFFRHWLFCSLSMLVKPFEQ